jgi:hypothetical protein
MKKLILSILSIFLISFTLYGTENVSSADVIEVSKSVVESITPDSLTKSELKSTSMVIYEDMKEVISGMAAALKVGSEHVYKVLVKQQVVYALIYLITFIFFGILFTISAFNLSKLGWSDISYYESDWKNRGGYDAYLKNSFSAKNFIFIITGLVGLIGFIIGFSNIDVIITGFLNPEYGAIKEIIKFIR